MARLTEEKIQQIKDAYAKDPVYSHVSKLLGVSPATIKKYVSGEVAPAKSKKNKDPDVIDFESLSNKDNLIEPLPVEEIEIPADRFRSWTLLTQQERDALNLGTFRRK